MTPSRPYLLRAFMDWILDNHLTPYLVISADMEGVEVPRAYVEGGRIILNISTDSIRNLVINNEHVSFYAKFGGIEQSIYAPMPAIQAIYAKENGRGMVFQEEEEEEPLIPPPSKPGKPTLTIVK